TSSTECRRIVRSIEGRGEESSSPARRAPRPISQRARGSGVPGCVAGASERLHSALVPLSLRGASERGGGGVRADLASLADAWRAEPDQAALDELAGVPVLAEAAASVTPEEAAVDYSRVVLGLAPPYASLFLHEAAMLNGPEAERVELIYRRFGFEIAPE